MRRLVADLLLLARTDVGRVVPREPCDLAQIVVEAAAELGPVSGEHEIALDVHPARRRGRARRAAPPDDQPDRERAAPHARRARAIRVSTAAADGQATLVVEDDGPGVPPELAPTLFERFVRGAGDRGGSFGLGLAIVQAVAESHGGSVTLRAARARHAARASSCRLPARRQTSTTTGSTIGRRLRRS